MTDVLDSRRLGAGELLAYGCDDGTMVYSPSAGQLYGLNEAASAVLRAFEAGWSVAQIHAVFGDDDAAWIASIADLHAGQIPTVAPIYREERDNLPPAPQVGAAEGLRLELLGSHFVLRCAVPAMAESLRSLLGHLPGFSGSHIDAVIDVEPEADSYRLFVNGQIHRRGLCASRVYPVVQDLLRTVAYQGTDYLITAHAAVLTAGDSCVVLPAESGSGKSTLAAALCHHGMQMLSDETAVLGRADGRLKPVPLSPGFKVGSWPLLKQWFAGFSSSAEHERWDGQAVRYLSPPPISGTAGARATHLVFPRFHQGTSLRCEELGTVEALRRLSAAGYQLKRKPSEADVQSLLAWVSGLRRVALTYGSTEQALQGLAACGVSRG